MILNKKFLETADIYNTNALYKKILKKIQNLFPNQLQEFTEADIIDYIIDTRIRCDELSIFTEKGIFGYLALGFLLGGNFLYSEEFLNLFKKADLSGDQVLEVFFSELINSCE